MSAQGLTVSSLNKACAWTRSCSRMVCCSWAYRISKPSRSVSRKSALSSATKRRVSSSLACRSCALSSLRNSFCLSLSLEANEDSRVNVRCEDLLPRRALCLASMEASRVVFLTVGMVQQQPTTKTSQKQASVVRITKTAEEHTWAMAKRSYLHSDLGLTSK